MRKLVITCDECRDVIRYSVFTYAHQALPGSGYATFEGQRSGFEFCSTGCLCTWLMKEFQRRAR